MNHLREEGGERNEKNRENHYTSSIKHQTSIATNSGKYSKSIFLRKGLFWFLFIKPIPADAPTRSLSDHSRPMVAYP